MPVAVFVVGCGIGTERFSLVTLGNMLVVSLGVAISAYGEINFVVMGVVLQLLAICTESTRLSLTQILLQSSGLKLNPITTLYYVAPCSLLFLSVPFFIIEAPAVRAWLCRHQPTAVVVHQVARYIRAGVTLPPWVLLTNAMTAFALNMAVFLLIGKTSALTMNIAGVVKDWMLIGLSVVLYQVRILLTAAHSSITVFPQSPVTQLNLIGYLIAFAAVCFYNYQKIQQALVATKNKVGTVIGGDKRVNMVASSGVALSKILPEEEGADIKYLASLNTPTKLKAAAV